MTAKVLHFMPLLLLAVLAGCQCENAPAPPPRGVHPAPLEAIAKCREGAERAREASAPSDPFAIMASACADIFVERGCRDAWLAAAKAEPAASIQTMVTGCRAAYCPLLSSPKPELCAKDDSSRSSQSEIRRLWPDFIAAVLERDLGSERKAVRELMESFTVSSQPVVIEVPPATARPGEETPVEIRLACSQACEIELLDGDGKKVDRWKMNPDQPDQVLEQVAKRAATVAKGKAATIQATPETTYSIVIAVMDALRDEGFDHLSMGVQRPRDGTPGP